MMAQGARKPASAGYSGTPLPKKLGFKDGQKVLFVGLPGELSGLAGSAVFAAVAQIDEWHELSGAGGGFDVIHAFTRSHAELSKGLGLLQSAIASDGTIWISWPKRASRIATDVTEDVIRAEALRLDLVDVKVAAVDDRWSGLKLVIRKQLRGGHEGKPQ